MMKFVHSYDAPMIGKLYSKRATIHRIGLAIVASLRGSGTSSVMKGAKKRKRHVMDPSAEKHDKTQDSSPTVGESSLKQKVLAYRTPLGIGGGVLVLAVILFKYGLPLGPLGSQQDKEIATLRDEVAKLREEARERQGKDDVTKKLERQDQELQMLRDHRAKNEREIAKLRDDIAKLREEAHHRQGKDEVGKEIQQLRDEIAKLREEARNRQGKEDVAKEMQHLRDEIAKLRDEARERHGKEEFAKELQKLRDERAKDDLQKKLEEIAKLRENSGTLQSGKGESNKDFSGLKIVDGKAPPMPPPSVTFQFWLFSFGAPQGSPK